MTVEDDRLREERFAEAAVFLGEVLERVETGKATFEACCAERPHLVQELKELYAACHRFQSSVDSSRSSGNSESEQTLDSELLRRLSGRKGSFERYKLRGEIAKGGQGTVMQVWDDDLNRHLAMKVLVGKGDASGAGAWAVTPRALSRFLEEAQVTGQLDHPGIVPIHELGLDAEGRVYFTMKLVKGRTLKEVFQLVAEGKEGWTLTRALSVMLKVCEAMSYAHHKGVVHRDLKPANVMVGRFGEVFVMDWGLARVHGREDRTDVRIAPEASSDELLSTRESAHSSHASEVVTMDGHVLGTPAYMSPEQALGRLEDIGPHSDVYSLGAMLYHLAAGHMPFAKPGTNPTNHSIWYAVQQGPPEPLHLRAPGAPAELVAICEKAMSREIRARYRDMGELGDDLMAFLEHRAVKAYQTGAAVELRKWVERNRGLAATSAAAVLALVAGLAVALVLKAQSDRNAALAARNAELASENAAESVLNEAAAKAKTAEAEKNLERAVASEESLSRLSALSDLDDLQRRADRLWPVSPELTERYEQWMNDATALGGELTLHEAKLAELRSKARPASAEPGVAADLAELVPSPALVFDSSKDRWWHDQLRKLVDGLYAFSNKDTGLVSGTSPEHGWGVKKRLELAETIAKRSFEGEAGALWAAAIESIRDRTQCPAYDGLVISPQLGLLPLGKDRESGLWEFAHLLSGEPAVRGADGKLVLTEGTGIVLVLLPGGSFWMGAQHDSKERLNYDPGAQPEEFPVNAVTLGPFFLSKYEMTQGQWERSTGKNPSMYRAAYAPPTDPMDLTHPVEQVSWLDCQQTLLHLGLALPTEAQWEYAARAGTRTIWWTGDEPQLLEGTDNLADLFLKRNAGPNFSDWACEAWLDGHVVHAAVGSFEPNQFGLHDVHGNVSEWCHDRFARYDERVRPGDGERDANHRSDSEGSAPEERVLRGGDYLNLAPKGRSAARYHSTPEVRQNANGVRPARSLSVP